MSEVHSRRLVELREEFERKRTEMTDLRARLEAVSATAESPRREVRVTVGSQGVLTDLNFPTSTYRRLAPAELAKLILDTTAEARKQVGAQTAEIMAPILPPGMDLAAVFSGAASPESLSLREPRMPDLVRERLAAPPRTLPEPARPGEGERTW